MRAGWPTVLRKTCQLCHACFEPHIESGNWGKMQILIHKANLVRLQVPVRSLRIGLGEAVVFVQDSVSEVAVMAMLPSRLSFGLGRLRKVKLGYLGDHTKAILMPSLELDTQLRVRIVELDAAHLRTDGCDRIAISVWGDPAGMIPRGSRWNDLLARPIQTGTVGQDPED
jgi:hypothetical protein